MSIVRRLVPTLLALCTLLGVGLVCFSSTALAAGAFTFESLFGKAGVGEGEFKIPGGVAVEQSTGDVFVADSGNRRVEVFGPEGEYLTQFNGSETPKGSFLPSGVAVDNSGGVSAGDVYVVDEAHEVVEKFKPKGSLPSEGYEYAAGEQPQPSEPLSEPAGVAVAADGDVYVTQFSRESAIPLVEFGPKGEQLAKIEAASLEKAGGVAVNATGSEVYAVVHGEAAIVKLAVNTTSHTVEHEETLDTQAPRAVAVDQATGTVYVDDAMGGAHISEYEASATEGTKPVEEFGAGEIGESSGVAYSSHGPGGIYITDAANDDIRIYDRESAGGEHRPEAACKAPKEIHAKTVVADCVLGPAGKEVEWHLEYRQEDVATFTSTAEEVAPAAGLVELTLSGLQPETGYVYRIAAVNKRGETKSAPVTFATLAAVPGISACQASNVLGSSATLEDSLEPNEATEYHFEYGVSNAYDLKTGVAHTGVGKVTPNVAITGLEPRTLYRCRLSATDSEGATLGASGTFETLAVRPTVDSPVPTAAEVTSTSVLLTGAVNPEKSPTTYHFEYGTTASYGSNTPTLSAGEGFGAQAVQAPQLTALSPETIYHFALVAENKAGIEVGPDYTFKTLPLSLPGVHPEGASGITATSATVVELVDPEGLPTTYEFDLGTDTTYGGTRIFGQVVEGQETISLTLEDLAPGTAYHYRIVAFNEDGTVLGADATFTTSEVLSPIVRPVAPQLLATPPLVFPTAPGVVIKPPPKKKPSKLKKKHHAKLKPEHKRKGKRRKK